jgi:hypothetical protein
LPHPMAKIDDFKHLEVLPVRPNIAVWQ